MMTRLSNLRFLLLILCSLRSHPSNSVLYLPRVLTHLAHTVSVSAEFGLTRFVQTKSNGQSIEDTYQNFLDAVKEVNPKNQVIDILDDIISAGKTTTAMIVLGLLSLPVSFFSTACMWPMDIFPKIRLLSPLFSAISCFWFLIGFAVWSNQGASKIDNFAKLALANNSDVQTSSGWCFAFIVIGFSMLLITTVSTFKLYRMKKDQYTDVEEDDEQFLTDEPYNDL